jgi:hypothetical protein
MERGHKGGSLDLVRRCLSGAWDEGGSKRERAGRMCDGVRRELERIGVARGFGLAGAIRPGLESADEAFLLIYVVICAQVGGRHSLRTSFGESPGASPPRKAKQSEMRESTKC